MIVGITGTIGAGKGSVVDYLIQKRGFKHISARSIWTAELKKRNLPIDRDHMTVLANQLRAEHGPAYFVEQALQSCDGQLSCVIESIRTVAEAELLKKQGGVLLAVDAERAVRYERIHARGSSLDQVSFADFVRQEETEMQNADPNKQNILAVMNLADHTISNVNTLESLHEQVDNFLKKYHD